MVVKLGDLTLQQVANICVNTSREACRFDQCPLHNICDDVDIRVLVYNDMERGDLQREEYVWDELLKPEYIPGGGRVSGYKKEER